MLLSPAFPQAVDILMEGVYEFNAVVPYSGVVGPTTGLDAQAVTVVLALLPPELHAGRATATLTAEDAKQVGGEGRAVARCVVGVGACWLCRCWMGRGGVNLHLHRVCGAVSSPPIHPIAPSLVSQAA